MKDRRCVFDNWSDTSAVETHRLSGRYFGTFQLSQKVQSLGCLFNDIINMTIPLKVAADSQTQNFVARARCSRFFRGRLVASLVEGYATVKRRWELMRIHPSDNYVTTTLFSA
jgi:hypothetical protein